MDSKILSPEQAHLHSSVFCFRTKSVASTLFACRSFAASAKNRQFSEVQCCGRLVYQGTYFHLSSGWVFDGSFGFYGHIVFPNDFGTDWNIQLLLFYEPQECGDPMWHEYDGDGIAPPTHVPSSEPFSGRTRVFLVTQPQLQDPLCTDNCVFPVHKEQASEFLCSAVRSWRRFPVALPSKRCVCSLNLLGCKVCV